MVNRGSMHRVDIFIKIYGIEPWSIRVVTICVQPELLHFSNRELNKLVKILIIIKRHVVAALEISKLQIVSQIVSFVNTIINR